MFPDAPDVVDERLSVLRPRRISPVNCCAESAAANCQITGQNRSREEFFYSVIVTRRTRGCCKRRQVTIPREQVMRRCCA